MIQRASGEAESRQARIERKTRETEILIQLNLDGSGAYKVETTIPFLNHMLEAMARHSLFDLTVDARGDTEVDLHHTVEDVAICLGKAFKEAVGTAQGITRFGSASVPMDEALVTAVVDCSNRPYLVCNAPLGHAKIGNFDVGMVQHFLRSFALNAGVTLHVNLHYGENLHHIIEAIFKACGRALAEATRMNPRTSGSVPSTKGSL
jgi:imidazoleglycerol-phosphate dehydratase